jgi:Flp pilus assembly protein TadG
MRNHEHGQSVVEFMLVIPFVLLVIMALVEFGTAFYAYITVNNATSEAARWAAVANVPNNACAANSIQWRAREMSRGLLACDNGTVFEITYEDAASGHPGRGTGVTVRVTRPWTPLTPLPGLVNFVSGGAFPATWNMNACSDARLEMRLPEGVYAASAGHCGA